MLSIFYPRRIDMFNIIRRRQYYLLCLLLISGMTSTATHAAELHPARVMVEQTANSIQQALRKERDIVKKDSKRLAQLMEEIVLPHFDFETMSASVIGKYWRKTSPEQRSQFQHAFKILLLRTYAVALVDNIDKTINYEPVREDAAATDVTVRTSIPQEGGFPLPINYSLELIDNQWKVYDVVIDSISMIKNYRSTFSKEISQHGIDHLIDTLNERNKAESS